MIAPAVAARIEKIGFFRGQAVEHEEFFGSQIAAKGGGGTVELSGILGVITVSPTKPLGV
jgi:hypothetical protein